MRTSQHAFICWFCAIRLVLLNTSDELKGEGCGAAFFFGWLLAKSFVSLIGGKTNNNTNNNSEKKKGKKAVLFSSSKTHDFISTQKSGIALPFVEAKKLATQLPALLLSNSCAALSPHWRQASVPERGRVVNAFSHSTVNTRGLANGFEVAGFDKVDVCPFLKFSGAFRFLLIHPLFSELLPATPLTHKPTRSCSEALR